MTSNNRNSQDEQGGNAREERLGELINEYFDRVGTGDPISKEEFLAQHPDCADELREHLSGLDLLSGLGSSSRITLAAKSPTPAGGSSAVDQLGAPQPLPNIPGYDIHKMIGRGGMGLVYKATQISTKRIVALKLLLEGPFAAEVAKKRFEREISLAAQLRHPNIIPIYDSGTCDGRMYYAMEHVYGMALIDYVRANTPDLKTRLKLFGKICHAVSHAHLRGVIHRDLKPSNIMVDGAGEPHILDFGLAKAGTFGDMSMSLTAQIVGTPAYMSPEQASGDPGGVDIRTDVYSLGMILYEMLTLQLPYETNVSIGKVLHNIAHAEPTPPAKLNSKIDSDLAALVLKSIEKNKETRYQSVDSFASDVQRYLAGEPITAKPPSGFYHLKKLALKYKLAVSATLFLLLIGAVGLVMVTRYSASLALKEQRLHEQTEDKIRLQKELEVKQAAIDAEEKRKKDAKQQMEALKKNLSPANQKAFDDLTRDLPEGLGVEALLPMMARKVAPALTGEQAPAPAKSTDFDASELMKSERVAAPAEKKGSSRLEELKKSLESSGELFKRQYNEYREELAKEEAAAAAANPTSRPTANPPTSSPST